MELFHIHFRTHRGLSFERPYKKCEMRALGFVAAARYNIIKSLE